MEDYLDGKTEYGWYLCLDGENIVGGLGVIENDFHERKDLFPNVCAVYTDVAYRGQGIAKALYAHVTDFAKVSGCAFITLNVWCGNDTAMKFYEKAGMTPRNIHMEMKLC